MAVQESAPQQAGDRIAELLNALVRSHSEQGLPDFQALVDQLPETIGDGSAIVIDDLDLVPLHALTAERDHVSRVASRFPATTMVFVTRYGIQEIAAVFGLHGQVRFIPADLLAIGREELPALIAHRSFGEASAEEVDHAFAQMGGWFAGIQRMVDRAVILESSIDDYVLNEILAGQSNHLQQVTIALSRFPRITNDLVNVLLAAVEETEVDSTIVFSQVPMMPYNGAPSTGSGGFVIPPQLQVSLARLERFAGNPSIIRELYQVGVQWFMRHGDYANARLLAIESDVVECYLEAILPHCTMLATDEHWTAIRELLVGIPYDLLDRSSDLTFWRMIAESALGNLNELGKMVAVVYESWKQSDDPLRQGRADLMIAWKHWGKSQPVSALDYAAHSVSVLPREAVQDRMFAVITAENAARNIGNPDQIAHWSGMNSSIRPVSAIRLEWWHVNSGYHRLSHLATTGKLNHAYHLAELSLSQVNPAYPRAAFRYQALLAYLDSESGQMERAHEHLAVAQQLSDGRMTENEIELLNARIALAIHEFDLAREALHVGRASERTRTDQYAHRIRILAEIELAAGNIDLAYDIITNWGEGEETWPKYFGEPNSALVRAKILVQKGLVQDALAASQYVINEARRRKHGFYLVPALAIQAECHVRLGRDDRLNTILGMVSEYVGDEPYVSSLAPFGRDVRLLTDPDVSTLDRRLTLGPAMAGFQISALTRRETELLRVAADGKSTREIADSLFISQSTVKNHMRSIYRKLGVSSRGEAIGMVFPPFNSPPE